MAESPDTLAALEALQQDKPTGLKDDETAQVGSLWDDANSEDQASKNSNSRSQKEGSHIKSKRAPQQLWIELQNQNGVTKNEMKKSQKSISQILTRASLPPENKRLKRHPSEVFENIVHVLIVISSIMLVLDNPLNDPKDNMMLIIRHADVAINCLFTLEATIKIIAKGLIHNKLGPV